MNKYDENVEILNQGKEKTEENLFVFALEGWLMACMMVDNKSMNE